MGVKKDNNDVKVKLCRDTASTNSETYETNFVMFQNG